MKTRSGKRLVTQPLVQIKEQINASGSVEFKKNKNLPHTILNLGFSSLQQYTEFAKKNIVPKEKDEIKDLSQIIYRPVYKGQTQLAITQKKNIQRDHFDQLYQDCENQRGLPSTVVDNSIKIDCREQQTSIPNEQISQNKKKTLRTVIEVKIEEDQNQIQKFTQFDKSKIIESTLHSLQQQLRKFLIEKSMKNNSKCILIRLKKIQKVLFQENQKLLQKLRDRYNLRAQN